MADDIFNPSISKIFDLGAVVIMEACYTTTPRIHRGDLKLQPRDEIARMAETAKALSDPIRLQMLYLLSQCEDLCTCEFSELLELSQSKVSYHLNELLQAGLVSRENHGTWSHYRTLHPQVLEHVKGWVQEGVVPG